MSSIAADTSPLDRVVRAQHAGRALGITSVCSAHPWVLRAALELGRESATAVLIEATSNQVDQFGGYTGLTPADFRDQVHALADAAGLDRDLLVLGGDHLGPNRWRREPADDAMAKSEDLIAAYVAAGFTKIHLDCSYPCADDDGPLTDAVVAERAARLLAVAERSAPDPARLRYVVGTEVPVPGGADHDLGELSPTTPDSARATISAHREAFARVGHEAAWSRVMGLVVQPGVEFDHLRVVDYRPELTRQLSAVVDDEPNLVFEAHSTDYQTTEALTDLVRDHWAVLKVGPGLTFALREALFALAGLEAELVPAAEGSALPEVVEQRMLAEPAQWQAYYPGEAAEQRLARRYSYSDRLRYYWPDPQIEAAVTTLVGNLRARPIPLPLLSAVLPAQYDRVRHGSLTAEPAAIVVDRVKDVLRAYASACSVDGDETEGAGS